MTWELRRCDHGRQDNSLENKTLSGRGGRATDTVTTQRQGTRRCQDAQREEVCPRVASAFRVQTNPNQDTTSDRRHILIRD